jgi:pyridoxamine 5'-phosphate oxidase-like protein
MRWSDVLDQQPRLGAIAHERLITPGVLLVVTIRADGTARLSPVEPFVLDGELWLSMMLGSRKAADLLRDPRVLVHNVVTSPDGESGELKVRGTARHEPDEPAQRRYAEAVSEVLPWSPEVGRFHLFAVDIEQVTFLRYDNASGDQYLVLWPPGRETVRRGTSATTVGEPEDVHDVLV